MGSKKAAKYRRSGELAKGLSYPPETMIDGKEIWKEKFVN